MSLFAPARKAQLKARIALAGPSGSGKTWTALSMATVLAGPEGRVGMLDTENRSGSLYADRFRFEVADVTPPYDLHRLVELLEAAAQAGFDALVIDSLSHWWEGKGGALEMVDAAARRNAGGNRFGGWKDVTPELTRTIDAIRSAPFHVIACMRSKTEWVVEEVETDGGRTVKKPRRIGMAPVFKAGAEYEFTILGELDLDHRMIVTKSRCPILADRVVGPHEEVDAARDLLAWLESGVQLLAPVDRADLVARIPRELKARFVEEVGHPDRLTVEELAAAHAWVEANLTPTPDPEPPLEGPSDPVGEPEPAPDPEPPLEGDGSTELAKRAARRARGGAR